MSEQKYSYEEAFKSSLDYFDQDSLAAKVWLDKYALKDLNGGLLEDTPDKMHWRIAKEFSRIEKKKFKNPLTEKEIFSYLDHFKYIVPQGSPMFGIGNDYQIISLSNCYVIETPQDSYGSILKTDQQIVQISKRRGGVGLDLSNLRPKGSIINNAAVESNGIGAWMERYSNSIREVGQSGRRGALMETISVHHPDILKFISIKNDETKVTGANISVKLTNEFLTALEKNENFELRFPIDYKEKNIKPKISKFVSAKDIWNEIINSAWYRAEPGLLFWDSIITNNAVDCYRDFGFETISTNPCSELPLCEYDSCRLLIQNLYSYVQNPFKKEAKFDFELFYNHAIISQRLMDDLIDLEIEKIDKILEKIQQDPEQIILKVEEVSLWTKIKEKCINGRRTGLGVTGAGDTIAAMGFRYGEEDSIKLVEKIHKTQKLASFRSSVEMAKEIGAFPIWSWEVEKNSKFLLNIKEEDIDLYNDIQKYGRRNIANLTIAPAGSVSLLTQTTSGIEPLFMMSYTRRKKINSSDHSSKVDFVDQSGDKWQEFQVYHPKIKIWMELTSETDVNKSPWAKSCANDINWVNRVKLQAAAQKHIDHAISSTINLPSSATKEDVGFIYLSAWKEGVKGITVYRDGCRTGVMIEKKEEKKTNEITKTIAPKRPKKLQCDLHHFVIKGMRYYCIVGLMNNEPYEIFTGTNNDSNGDIIISKNIDKGFIIKESRGKYIFLSDKNEFILTNGHADPTADALTRLISTSLRHGADISFIVDQLEKTKGEMISFAKVLGRTLKKYIKNGTKVSGQKCDACGGTNLVRENGCVICKDCGGSKCS